MTPLDKQIDEVFASIQAEYDGGEPMLPGTIPQAKAHLKEFYAPESIHVNLRRRLPPHTKKGKSK